MLRSELLQWLAAHLVALGPGVLFVVCVLETAVFAGLILPVGALIAFAAMLASRGLMDPAQIAMVAFFGAVVGDQVGFAVGRWVLAGARPRGGRITRIWRGALSRAESLMRRRGLIGVSLARTIPFVRTMMPWLAGRSGIPWGRFFVYDLLGVLLWGSIYVGGGLLAGEGWRQVAGRYGETAGALALALAVILFLFLTRRVALRALRWRRGVQTGTGAD
jgi:membrane-associated protein